MAKHYREPNLFAFPPVNGGFGLVLLEAMASGLPVVAIDTSGAADLVTEGRGGFVVASGTRSCASSRLPGMWRGRSPCTGLSEVRAC